MDSILNTIKKMLGVSAADTNFDMDIIVDINMALATLRQLGVGPSTGYMINSATEVWDDFISNDPRLGLIKSYIYYSVKLVFDPPTSSAVITMINEKIKELECRIQYDEDATQQ